MKPSLSEQIKSALEGSKCKETSFKDEIAKLFQTKEPEPVMQHDNELPPVEPIDMRQGGMVSLRKRVLADMDFEDS